MRRIKFNTPETWISKEEVIDMMVGESQIIEVKSVDDEYIESLEITYYNGDGEGAEMNIRRSMDDYMDKTIPEYYTLLVGDSWFFETVFVNAKAYYYINQTIDDPFVTLVLGADLSVGEELYVNIRIKGALSAIADTDKILDFVSDRISFVS